VETSKLNQVVEIRGTKPGPTSLVLGGVHGDETCGVEAITALRDSLKINRGRVLLAYGNPRAIQAGTRFSQANLNRMFKPDAALSADERASYEYARAQELKPYFAQADAALDVHASFTPNSRPFVICEPQAREVAGQLPVDLVVSGFDQVQPGGTDYYMNQLGKVGICLECGYLGDQATNKIARDGILAFLQARRHIQDAKTSARQQTKIRVFFQYMTKTSNFILAKRFKDFEQVKQGQLIGQDGSQAVVAPRSSAIIFARNRKLAGEEAFLLAAS
jgi:succinylglutamate desuccinylase